MYYENIWIADESKAKSIFKHRVYDSVSDIDIQSDKIIFEENRREIHFSDINSIRLGRQRIAYLSYLQASVVVFLSVFGNEKNGLFYAIIPLLSGVILGLAIGWWFQRWAIINFTEGEKSKELYLADGNAFGYKGIFGGTKSLFLKLSYEVSDWKHQKQDSNPSQ